MGKKWMRKLVSAVLSLVMLTPAFAMPAFAAAAPDVAWIPLYNPGDGRNADAVIVGLTPGVNGYSYRSGELTNPAGLTQADAMNLIASPMVVGGAVSGKGRLNENELQNVLIRLDKPYVITNVVMQVGDWSAAFTGTVSLSADPVANSTAAVAEAEWKTPFPFSMPSTSAKTCVAFSTGWSEPARALYIQPSIAPRWCSIYIFGYDPSATGSKITIGNMSNGAVSADKTSAEQGETVTLTVAPAANYRMTEGSLLVNGGAVSISGSGNVYTFSMPDEPVTVTAAFEKIQYTITCGAYANGAVTADKAAAGVGDAVTLTVTPNPGYRLKAGTLKFNATAVNETTPQFAMPGANVTIYAEFEPLPSSYAISIGTMVNGTVSAPASAYAGDTVTLTVQPDYGYRLKAGTLKFNSTVISGNSFIMPEQAVTIQAEFEAAPPVQPRDFLTYATKETFHYAPYGYNIPYRLYVPDGTPPVDGFPVVMFLHGAGEGGTNNEAQVNGNASILYRLTDTSWATQYPCVIIAPQFNGQGGGAWGSERMLETLWALVEKTQTDYNADRNKLYVMGLSQGGGGTVSFATKYPDKVAAAVPVCPWIPGPTGGKALTDVAPDYDALKDVPAWYFCGDRDDVTGAYASRYMVDETRKAGGEARYTEFPGVAHSSWGRAWTEPGLVDWMFSKSLTNRTPRYYSVTTAAPNGVIAPNKTIAAAGETVTFTAAPNSGYALQSNLLLVNNGAVAYTGSGTYSFTMPEGDAVISAKYIPSSQSAGTPGKIDLSGVENKFGLSNFWNATYHPYLKQNGGVNPASYSWDEQNKITDGWMSGTLSGSFGNTFNIGDGGIYGHSETGLLMIDFGKVYTVTHIIPLIAGQANGRANGGEVKAYAKIGTDRTDNGIYAPYTAYNSGVGNSIYPGYGANMSLCTVNGRVEVDPAVWMEVGSSSRQRSGQSYLEVFDTAINAREIMLVLCDVATGSSIQIRELGVFGYEPDSSEPGTLYSVTLGSFVNGAVSADKAQARQGETVTLTVSPSSGYKLTAGSLKVNNGAVPVNGGDGVYTFTMPGEAVTVTAAFEELGGLPPGTPQWIPLPTAAQMRFVYGVDKSNLYTSGNGTSSATKMSVKNEYIVNNNLTDLMPGLIATPQVIPSVFNETPLAGGYDEINGTTSRVDIVLPDTYVVTHVVVSHGRNAVSPAGAVAITYKLNADPGWTPTSVTNVAKPGGGANPTYDVLACGWIADKITVIFDSPSFFRFSGVYVYGYLANAAATYPVTVASAANGAVSADKAQAAQGETVALTVVPSPGYRLTAGSLKVNGGAVAVSGSGSSYTFVMPGEAVTVTAAFEAAAGAYAVNIAQMTNGAVSADKSAAEAGETVALTVAPSSGYKLTAGSLKVNGGAVAVSGSGSSYTFVMPGQAVTVTADFEPTLLKDTVQPRELKDAVQMLSFTSGDPALVPRMDYLLHVPEGPADKAPYPVVVLLHSNGQQGFNFIDSYGDPILTNTWIYGYPGIGASTGSGQMHIARRLTEVYQNDYPAFIIIPQCPSDMWVKFNNLDAVWAIIDSVLREYDYADRDRLYVIGESLGGTGAWGFASRFADKVAAVAPVMGRYPYEWSLGTLNRHPDYVPSTVNKPAMKDIPIWVGHCADDPQVVVQNSRDWVADLRALGSFIMYTEYPEGGHGAPLEKEPAILPWMFSQSRAMDPARQFTPSVRIEPSGTGTVTGVPTGPIDRGTTVSFTVQPAPGYRVKKISYSGATPTKNGVTYSFKMPTYDVTVTAEFEPGLPDGVYSITTSGANGAITVNATQAEPGDIISFTVEPDAGYKVKTGSLTVKKGNDLVDFSGSGPYTFVMPAGNVHITASFISESGSGKLPVGDIKWIPLLSSPNDMIIGLTPGTMGTNYRSREIANPANITQAEALGLIASPMVVGPTIAAKGRLNDECQNVLIRLDKPYLITNVVLQLGDWGASGTGTVKYSASPVANSVPSSVVNASWQNPVSFSFAQSGSKQYYSIVTGWTDPAEALYIEPSAAPRWCSAYVFGYEMADAFQVIFGGNVTATVDGSSINSEDLVIQGKDVVFTAVPGAGYQVKEWTVNGAVQAGQTGNIFTLVDLREPVEVNVEFELIQPASVEVTFDANGGTAAVPPSKTVQVGSVYGALPVVTRGGYDFDGWFTAATGGTLITAATTVTNGQNHTLYAHWTEIPAVNVTVSFDLNYSPAPANPADITVQMDSAYGALPVVTRGGYDFDGWFTAATGGTEVTAATTVTNGQNHTLYAHWTRIPVLYAVAYGVAGGNGTLGAAVGGTGIGASPAQVIEGSDIVFTAAPDAGYQVKEWTVNGSVQSGQTGNAFTLTDLRAAVAVTVEFELIPPVTYAVTYGVTGGNGTLGAAVGGTAIGASPAQVIEGSDIVFTAAPDAGYQVKEWTVNGTVQAGQTGNAFILTDLRAAVAVTVEFELIPPVTYAVTYGVTGGNGTLGATVGGTAIGVSPAQVIEGSDIVFTAAPDAGYQVKEWTVNGTVQAGQTGNTFTLTDLRAAVAVTVEFERVSNVDKSGLAEILAQAKLINQKAYTAATAATLAAAIELGEDVMDNGGATQGDVDDAIAALEEAISGLVKAELICPVKSILAKVGKLQQIPCTWNGVGALRFATSNTAVCSVTQDGILIPMKAGIAVITITAPDDSKIVFAVTVSA